jgi:hypothetical protein
MVRATTGCRPENAALTGPRMREISRLNKGRMAGPDTRLDLRLDFLEPAIIPPFASAPAHPMDGWNPFSQAIATVEESQSDVVRNAHARSSD